MQAAPDGRQRSRDLRASFAITQLRRYLLDHPLVVLELGFRPVLNRELPYGFDVARTVPTDRWFRQQQHDLEQPILQGLLAATVRDLREEIPGLGEVVAFDVTHIYAFVKENNPRVYVKERFKKEQQPRGDRDCKLGVKKSTNREQADGSKKEEKPTGCATSCTSQAKWLQMVLHGISGFGTKWNCCRIARPRRRKRGRLLKQTGILCPPEPLRGIGHSLETTAVLASSSLVSS
jgi:hypothetical protein